jgi:DNA-directed RNA polymerase subunit M/transcription elongation factor TFIIS
MSLTIAKIENPELFRNNIRKKLNEKLNQEKNSENLEKGIFNFSLKEASRCKVVKKWDNKYFIQIYLDRLRSIMNNLRPDIIKNINDGIIKPHVIAFMTHQELYPEKWSTFIEAKIKRDKNKFEVKMKASTDAFTCRKCKSTECMHYELQTRSADESMTVYVQCCNCSYRWKTS